jgi:hypothetical protein
MKNIQLAANLGERVTETDEIKEERANEITVLLQHFLTIKLKKNKLRGF